MGSAMRRGYSSKCSTVRTPAGERGHGGVRQRELHRGGTQRDAVARADRAKSLGALDQWRAARIGSRSVAPGPRIRQQPAVHDAHGHDGDALLLAQRKQLVQRGLVKERVPPGHHEDIEVALASEAGEHRGLVHARADGPHHALAAQPLQRRVGAADGRLPVVVRVMDVEDVDAVQAEAARLSSTDRRTPSWL